MQDRQAMLTGLGVGAGLMFLLDLEAGGRRRALIRDRLARAANKGADAVGATSRDVAHRASGAAARVRGALRNEIPDDDVLVQRVRAQLGRVCSHPHAIDVTASNGVVTVRGPILKAEANRVLLAIERVRGVDEVVSLLDEHKESGSVPALQGGSGRPGLRPDVWQNQWSPTARLMFGTAGLTLAGYGLSRRDVGGTLLAFGGSVLLARAAANVEIARLTGVGAGRRAVDLQKTITIRAPIEDVFAFWTDYTNFPSFMSRVLDVRPSGAERQSHWTVVGPLGTRVEFDAEVSAFVPNKVFAWRTVEGSPVAHAGIVHFEPTRDGGTRVHIRMSYNPPGGWIGHGIAAAFGVDPKSSLDADLVRMKTTIETGRIARDAARAQAH